MSFNMTEWVDMFVKAAKRPMSEEEMLVMMAATLDPEWMPEGVQEDFMYQVISKRAEAMGLNPEPACVLFLSLLLTKPGESSMYCSVFLNRGLDLTMKNLTDLFPDGFPTDAELSELWNLQKLREGNAVDLRN